MVTAESHSTIRQKWEFSVYCVFFAPNIHQGKVQWTHSAALHSGSGRSWATRIDIKGYAASGHCNVKITWSTDVANPFSPLFYLWFNRACYFTSLNLLESGPSWGCVSKICIHHVQWPIWIHHRNFLQGSAMYVPATFQMVMQRVVTG